MIQRILLVDDDKNTCTALAQILREEGYTVDTCAEGQGALALLSRAVYDVLVTDYMMPGMNGLELVRAAKARQGRLCCVIMSGHPPTKGATEQLTWLTKPVDLDQLIMLLEK